MTDLYEVLRVSPSSSREEIKRAYHQLLLQVHPDKKGSSGQFQAVDAAWKTLGDEASRRTYDARLESARTQSLPRQDELPLRDMRYQDALDAYTCACRCGGTFLLAREDADSDVVLDCDSCSLSILVKTSPNKES